MTVISFEQFRNPELRRTLEEFQVELNALIQTGDIEGVVLVPFGPATESMFTPWLVGHIPDMNMLQFVGMLETIKQETLYLATQPVSE